MIGKQTKGRGFSGCIGYVLGKEGAELIGGNMLGENAQELSSEFSESRKLRPNVERAVYHASLSLSAGERLTHDQWNRVAESYVEQMGFQGSQYCVTRHQDTAHDHIHIVASRIRMDGTVVSDSQDYQRSEHALRGIEREYGLTQVMSSREVEQRAPKRWELDQAVAGNPSTRMQLQGLVDEAAHERPTMTQFLGRLEAAQVHVLPNVATTGHVSGVTYLLDGEPMKGSDLGRRYTWAGLQKQGVQYEPNRDGPAVGRAKERAEAEWGRRFPDGPALGGAVGSRRGRNPGAGTHRRVSPNPLPGGQGYSPGAQERFPGRQGMPGEGRGSIGHHRAPERAPNPQALDRNAPRQPRQRSREREQLLTLAASLQRRQGGRGSVERAHGSVSAAFPGETKAGRSAPVWNPFSLDLFHQEVSEIEAEREAKAQREREERERKRAQERARAVEGRDLEIDF